MTDSDSQYFYCSCSLGINLNFLGEILNEKSGFFGVPNFQNFLQEQNKIIPKPKKLGRATTNLGDDPLKIRVFKAVNTQIQKRYNQQLKHYEQAILQQELLKKYAPTKGGYAQYLTENFKVLSPFLNRTNKIPISQKGSHTYITGGTGSGKSELLKSLIWHYLTRNKSTGLILLTPNGEIAEQVAKFWVNLESNRLIYIEPNLDGFFPCLNPFDVPNKEDLSDIQAENYAQAFLSVFGELLGETEFTAQMKALLQAVLPVVIKFPNSSIYDLIDFLEPAQDKTHSQKVHNYLDFANNNLKNKGILDFLNGQFLYDDTYNRTKFAIHTRLRTLFNSTVMQAVMVGRSTLNIEQAIEQRKLIVFNFAKGKLPIDYRVLGLFILANIKILSFRRDGKSDFVPCHLFIDEFQNYITPSLQEILEESRKFGLFMTFAQQQAGARMKSELFRSILGNTAIKFTGVNEVETLQILAKETGETVLNYQENLKIRRFSLWQKARLGDTQKPPIFVDIPTNTADNSQSMTAEQWNALKTAQIEAFYCSMAQSTQTQSEAPKTPKNTQILDDFDAYFN